MGYLAGQLLRARQTRRSPFLARIDEQSEIDDRYVIEMRQSVQHISAKMIIGAAKNNVA